MPLLHLNAAMSSTSNCTYEALKKKNKKQNSLLVPLIFLHHKSTPPTNFNTTKPTKGRKSLFQRWSHANCPTQILSRVLSHSFAGLSLNTIIWATPAPPFIPILPLITLPKGFLPEQKTPHTICKREYLR